MEEKEQFVSLLDKVDTLRSEVKKNIKELEYICLHIEHVQSKYIIDVCQKSIKKLKHFLDCIPE